MPLFCKNSLNSLQIFFFFSISSPIKIGWFSRGASRNLGKIIHEIQAGMEVANDLRWQLMSRIPLMFLENKCRFGASIIALCSSETIIFSLVGGSQMVFEHLFNDFQMFLIQRGFCFIFCYSETFLADFPICIQFLFWPNFGPFLVLL